ncbi:killer toxin [Aspergillus crustosus]
MHLPTILSIGLVLTTTSALGINCRGSSDCSLTDCPSLGQVLSIIEEIDDNSWFDNGEHIACIRAGAQAYSLCAFLQNSGGALGSSIKTLARELQQHGCGNCGSVPLFYPGDNDVNNGELTFNAVW